MLSLTRRTAVSRSMTFESAKKHGCMTVLMRPPRPTSLAIRLASTVQTVRSLSMTCCWTSSGRWSHTSSAGYGALSSTVAPGRAVPSTLMRSSSPNWWQATKSAFSIR